MKVQKIKKSWMVAHAHRIDAPFHLSDGVRTKLLLKECPYKKTTLEEESKDLFKGNIHRRVYVDSEEHGYPFLTASDMFKSDLYSGKYISKKYSPYLKELALKKDWIVITRSGTLGKVLYTNEDFDGKIGTDDLIRINPSEKNIKRGFLYAFLKSKYGYALLTQSGYGGVVKHIEPEQIKDIQIPIIPDLELNINKLIITAAELRNKASLLLKEANERFFELNNINIDDEWLAPSENKVHFGFKVNKSSSFDKSIKARNFSYRATFLINYLSKKEGKLFKDWVTADGLTRGKGGFFKRINSINFKGVDIISQGDIHQLRPRFKQVIKKKKIKKSEVANQGMIIFPAAGTLGESEVFLRPMLIYENFEGKLLSEVVGKLTCNNLQDAAYVFAFLNSKIGFRIFRSKVYGTNLMYPNWELLKNINIPCLNKEVKKIISEIIVHSFKLKAQAQKNEDSAIKLLETEIESWQN